MFTWDKYLNSDFTAGNFSFFFLDFGSLGTKLFDPGVSVTLGCHPGSDAAAVCDCLGYQSVFLPPPRVIVCDGNLRLCVCVPCRCPLSVCVYVCGCPSSAQM